MKIHIVQQGDTLWKLAKKYDVDFEQLKAVNNHLSNPDVIMPGMKIKIPTGGVPVKKQGIKKEEPIKAAQPKEVPVPKKEAIVPPPKEEVKIPPPPAPPIQQPIEVQPIQPPITQQQYLHHMNMNFNVYKPMPMQPPPQAPVQMPAPPPKMPEMKELPKVEKLKPMVPPAPPVPPKKELPKPPVKPMKEQPMAAPMAPPPSYPMQQNCYPVTGIMPGCAYPPMVPGCHPYPGMAPTPYGYQGPVGAPLAGYSATPMAGYPQMHGFPQVPQQMPVFPQTQFGMMPPPAPDNDDDVTPQVPSGSMQIPPMQVPQSQYWGTPNTQGLYGDITMQQPMMPTTQPMMPQTPPWGYQTQPMYPQFNPYQGQQFRFEDEEDESED